jgi:23S rRNA (cytosine1962-C5)-methyltransferase
MNASQHRKGGRDRTTTFDQEPIVGSKLDYELLDSGNGEKLERFGDVTLVRPMAHAVWKARLEKKHWQAANGRYVRSTGGGGRWKWSNGGVPQSWLLKAHAQSMVLKTTSFGHLGIFPEQAAQWQWITERCTGQSEPVEVLNLFAYTGGSTLAAALGGASVCHVDAARGSVDWARENARRSGLENHPVRWIVDDVQIFLGREIKRQRRYHGIVLDPPSFGRGKKGETWKIEEDLIPLLEQCQTLLADKPLFFLLSCHSAGFTPQVLKNLVAEHVPEGGQIDIGEMLLEGSANHALPSGSFARWSPK